MLSSAGAAASIIFDLGADYATKQNTADHVIIARGDLASLGTNTATLYRSSDGNAWTSVTTVSGATGPRSNDYITTFATTSAYRYWRLSWTSAGTSTFQHSKCYFGKFFTFDFDCHYTFEKIPLKKSVWYSSAGAQYFTRNDEPLYKVYCTWEHQSDATVYAFENKIAKYMRYCPVFLYTTAEHQALNNVGLLHASLTKYKVEKQWNNLNTITADFEEELG